MRIHTNILTRQDFTNAAKHAGVTLIELSEHGSQSRARAFKFTLEGTSGRPPGFGQGDWETATWDEWGIVFAHLFDIDPEAHCGKNGYQSAEHYHWVTGNRFRTLTPLLQHKRHNWLSGVGGTSITGTFHVRTCKCGAVQRWLAYGHQWEEIAS